MYIYREKCAVNFQMHFDDAAAMLPESLCALTQCVRGARINLIFMIENIFRTISHAKMRRLNASDIFDALIYIDK